MNFDQAQSLFKKDRIQELASDPDGLRFLKLRSLSRREYLERLFQSAGVSPSAREATALFREAYNSAAITPDLLDALVRSIYESERAARRAREPELVDQLYRMQVFNWGGLHQNSLEKTIVDNYVKRIISYGELCEKIDNELHNSLRGYVLCSWYNHWTSIIIEDVFRDHPRVVPAVGLVKKIDFFVDGVPFDLKVTYLPEGFAKHRRRADGERPELTLLRKSARKLGIHHNAALPEARLLEDLWVKHRDHPSTEAQSLIRGLHDYRVRLVETCRGDPIELIRWLYENQGVRRFDASNRLFLVLVDRSNFFESWKHKRAKPLLHERITGYLDSIGSDPGHEVKFDWEGTTYAVVSDVVFIINP